MYENYIYYPQYSFIWCVRCGFIFAITYHRAERVFAQSRREEWLGFLIRLQPPFTPQTETQDRKVALSKQRCVRHFLSLF